jgi:hypothetical protein
VIHPVRGAGTVTKVANGLAHVEHDEKPGEVHPTAVDNLEPLGPGKGHAGLGEAGPSAAGYQPGDAVVDPKYGPGKVVGASSGEWLRVQFDSGKVRHVRDDQVKPAKLKEAPDSGGAAGFGGGVYKPKPARSAAGPVDKSHPAVKHLTTQIRKLLKQEKGYAPGTTEHTKVKKLVEQLRHQRAEVWSKLAGAIPGKPATPGVPAQPTRLPLAGWRAYAKSVKSADSGKTGWSLMKDWAGSAWPMRLAQMGLKELKGHTTSYTKGDVASFEKAASKAPQYLGDLWRGFGLKPSKYTDDAALHQVLTTEGATIEWNCHNGFSKSESTASHFGSGEQRYLFHVKGSPSMQDCSSALLSSEQEVYSPKGARYKVTKVEKPTWLNKRWKIELEEIT